jgi:hypothetical protein
VKRFPLKNAFLFLLAFILFQSAIARQDSLRKRQFFVSGFFSPTHQKNFYPQEYLQYYIPPTRQQFSYRCGMEIKFLAAKRWGFSIGCLFDVHKTETKDILLKDAHGQYYFDKNFRYRVNEQRLTVPLRLEIRSGKKPLALFFTTGISTSYLLKYISIVRYTEYPGTIKEQKTTGYTIPQGFGMLVSSLQIGVGIDYCAKRFRLQAFPMYEGTIRNSLFGPPYYSNTISLGFSCGYRL